MLAGVVPLYVVRTLTALFTVLHFHNVLNSSRSNYCKPAAQSCIFKGQPNLDIVACALLVLSWRGLGSPIQADAINIFVYVSTTLEADKSHRIVCLPNCGCVSAGHLDCRNCLTYDTVWSVEPLAEC